MTALCVSDSPVCQAVPVSGRPSRQSAPRAAATRVLHWHFLSDCEPQLWRLAVPVRGEPRTVMVIGNVI